MYYILNNILICYYVLTKSEAKRLFEECGVEDEKLENFDTIHEEFQKAYDLRNEVLVGLHQEIKNVKSLKV